MKINEIQNLIQETYQKYLRYDKGQLASYIPELSKVDPELFAISYVDISGEKVSIGNHQKLFTIQSTSKPTVYALALNQKGEDFVHSKVGVEPTGEAFNSIIELEEKSHRPFNPMINSGAIATTSFIWGQTFAEKQKNILEYFESFVGHALQIDENVFESEKKTAHRNRAIIHLMKHFDVIEADIEETLDLYFKQCSILMSSDDLALLAATYANQGVQPLTHKKIMSIETVSNVLSLMFSCGMYDTAGEWAFKVGLPAKSGVSGALYVVAPGRFGLCVYSPRIDQHGHSCRGRLVVEELAKKLNAHIFKSGV